MARFSPALNSVAYPGNFARVVAEQRQKRAVFGLCQRFKRSHSRLTEAAVIGAIECTPGMSSEIHHGTLNPEFKPQ